MYRIRTIFLLASISTFSGCISTLKSNKSSANTAYSEDLSSYLPPNLDTNNQPRKLPSNQPSLIDSSLIITNRLDATLDLVNAYNRQKTLFLDGLTIQLYSGFDRAKAKKAQVKAQWQFKGSTPIIIFDQPNYKVRMGVFYSQLDAYPLFKSVQAKFARAILVPIRIPVSNK